MKKATVILVVLSGILGHAGAKVLFYEDFESGNYSKWPGGNIDGAGAGLTIQTAVARQGRYAAHFTCDSCTRSELTGAPYSNFDWGREYWLGFSLYLPVLPTGNRIINQHHSIPGNNNWNCVAGPNSFTLHINGLGNLRVLTSTNDALVDSTPPKGDATWGTEAPYVEPARTSVWHDFVLHFIYAPDNTGLMEVWLNKAKVITNRGPTVYLRDLCGVEKVHQQYLKIGVYLGGGSGEIYYDEIRIGDAASSLTEMSPPGGSTSPEPGRAPVLSAGAAGPDAIFDIRGNRVKAPSRSGIYLCRVQGKVMKRVFLN